MTFPLLIALPDGLNASGVTTWAVRLANALVDRGHAAGLILHAEPPHQQRLTHPIDPRVGIFGLAHLPRFEHLNGDLAPVIAAYRDAMRELADHAGAPVAISPNLRGDCYGAVAALAQVEPELVRPVGWQHSDIPYDSHLLAHFAPMLHRFVAVSERIEQRLNEALPGRTADVRRIPYGVEVPPSPPQRSPLHGRPLRLLYTGRIEHEQKRIGALLEMSRALDARAIDHELILLGDGPAAPEIDARCEQLPSARRLPPQDAAGVRRLLRRADCLVLASRYEGLSVSMLEAMAEGCVPIVTRVASGAAEAVTHGETGLLVDAAPDDDDRAVGDRLADAIASFTPMAANASNFLSRATEVAGSAATSVLLEGAGRTRPPRQSPLDPKGSDRCAPGVSPASETLSLTRLSTAAHARAHSSYSIGAHADAVCRMLSDIAAAEPRPWPASRPCAHTSTSGASATLPEDAAANLRRVLAKLQGRAIALHGAGRHTLELLPVLAASGANIVAVADDDPQQWGGSLCGWPIVAPRALAASGATDLVISSWLHESDIWTRRAIYQRQGVGVHRLYAAQRGVARASKGEDVPPAPRTARPEAA